jgi:DNA-nicking Smr family endonuclease
LSNNISKKDKKDWLQFINSKEKLYNKDKKIKINKRPGTRSIDLHGYTLDEANTIIEKFIFESFDEGIDKLIVITGKGIHSNNENNPFVSKDLGILKNSIPNYIQNNKDLMKKIIEIKEADIKDGGSGAFYIYLKK